MSLRLLRGAHDGEAQPGLPETLPAGERLLWQGSPDWRILARHAFHVRPIALYFAVLIAWRVASAWSEGAGPAGLVGAVLWTLPLAAVALGIFVLLAWLVHRTSVYTLTDRRVVLRIGIVLTVSFNLPLTRIETVRLHPLGRGGPGRQSPGDIALVLDARDRIGYLHLWPHARPWHLRRTEPMLRALVDADAVARLLVEALQARSSADEGASRARPEVVTVAGPAADPQPLPRAA